MSSNTGSSILRLCSQDGRVFLVEKDVTTISDFIQHQLRIVDDSYVISLPEIQADVLEKVVQFMEYYRKEPYRTSATPAPSMKDEVQKWYADFVEVDHDTQFALLAASGYLDIQPLCDLICPAIVTKVQGKSHGEIRELYKVSYDSIADFDKFDDDSICHSQCSSSHGVSSKNSKNSEDTGTNKKIDSTKN